MCTLPDLPPLSEAEVAAGARPGESWEDARRRVEQARYVRAPEDCVVCGHPFWLYAHAKPSHTCWDCEREWSREFNADE